MSIFFGKISQKIDINQINEGYYIAPRGSSWFGDLEIDDFVYLIGGDKIQFWKAREWDKKNDKDILRFEILNPDLGINVSQLIALKYLRLTKALAVLTSRSARSKAFFKLDLLKDIPLADLSSSQFYKNPELYRSIKIVKSGDVIENSEDIQLTFENNKLELVDNDFIDISIKEQFIDNLDKRGNGAKLKDPVLDYFFKATNNLPTEITYKEIGLRRFYDTFFCDYKDKSIDDVTGVRYWLYAPGENASKWDEFYSEGIMALGWDDIGNLQNLKNRYEIKEALVNQYGGDGDKRNDVSANDDFNNKINIEDVIIVKKGRGELLGYGIVSSDYYYDEERDNYKHCRTVNWLLKGNWKLDFSLVLKTLTDITRYPTKNPNYSNYYELLLAIMKDQQIDTKSVTQMKDLNYNTSLNQILYGPPGTGKTYELQQIIKRWDLDKKIGTEKDYNSFVKNYTWWQIIALVLFEKEKIIVPELAQHPLIIAKLGSSNVKSLKTRLWSSLQNHTVENCANVKLAKRVGEKVFYKEANSEWRLDNKTEFQLEFTPIIEAYEEFKISDNAKSKDYTFTTCHQSLSYEDFIEGIKPKLNDSDSLDNEDGESQNLIYETRKGIFYNASEKAAQKAGFINLKDCLSKTKEERKIAFEKATLAGNIHVIFLDEINRCNVSNVFGELITLIEEDKRLGGENEIADITLPYSQEEFGVPSNLYIIGTMNTADRSVEALDTALRRRFSFEEMLPQAQMLTPSAMYCRLLWKYEFVGWQDKEFVEKENELFSLLDVSEEWITNKVNVWNTMKQEKDKSKISYFDSFPIHGVDLKKLLEKINKRIEHLIGKDHTIGHSYFISINNLNDLKYAFQNKIIPLLQEYFFGDYGKIGLVLGQDFFEPINSSDDDLFAEFHDYDGTDFTEKTIYSLKNITFYSDEEIKIAIETLLK